MNFSAMAALSKGDISNFEIASKPGGIEAQEAQGQKDFCNSGTFPKKHAQCTREQFEALGVVYLECAEDNLFINVELPAGWTIKPNDHPMWNSLIDNKGKLIASIFYKAAFYDRDAFIRLEQERVN